MYTYMHICYVTILKLIKCPRQIILPWSAWLPCWNQWQAHKLTKNVHRTIFMHLTSNEAFIMTINIFNPLAPPPDPVYKIPEETIRNGTQIGQCLSCTFFMGTIGKMVFQAEYTIRQYLSTSFKGGQWRNHKVHVAWRLALVWQVKRNF